MCDFYDTEGDEHKRQTQSWIKLLNWVNQDFIDEIFSLPTFILKKKKLLIHNFSLGQEVVLQNSNKTKNEQLLSQIYFK